MPEVTINEPVHESVCSRFCIDYKQNKDCKFCINFLVFTIIVAIVVLIVPVTLIAKLTPSSHHYYYIMHPGETRLVPVDKPNRFTTLRISSVDCTSNNYTHNITLYDLASVPNLYTANYNSYLNLTMHPHNTYGRMYHLMPSSYVNVSLDFPAEINLQVLEGEVHLPDLNYYLYPAHATEVYNEYFLSANYSIELTKEQYIEFDISYHGSPTMWGIARFNLTSQVYNVSSPFAQYATPCTLTPKSSHFYVLSFPFSYNYTQCRVEVHYQFPVGFLLASIFGSVLLVVAFPVVYMLSKFIRRKYRIAKERYEHRYDYRHVREEEDETTHLRKKQINK